MSDVNRRLGGVLVGVGGLSAALALLCCAAPWMLSGALVALGLGFILKDAILMSLAVVGLLIAFAGWRLMRKHILDHYSGWSIASYMTRTAETT